ncbi:molybdate ABC transporter substrate-binding protein [Slackia heliotrinireducens]|uniref:molybdate ABC transporter substrate-binding protein n=1 Tax=Slackia heliotrinireducens TaxID=84110 RepID=UPI003315B84D
MKKWKVALASTMAVALIAAFGLFGCSGGTEEAEQSAEETTEATEPAAEETEGEAEEAVEAEPVQLQIFAANSLEKCLPEVQALYTEQNPNVTFADTQFKSSGDLVSQLSGGATADLFISASSGKMDTAVEDGTVDEATRVDMFLNDLVVCAAADSDITIAGLEDLGTDAIATFAIGEPNAVPAGKYAVQSLETAGLCTINTDADGVMTIDWDASVADKVNAGADKVGTVASYVSEGQVELGFVYTSDIYRYDGIQAIYTVPADAHSAIVYPGAVCTTSTNAEVAQDFLNFCLTDPAAQAIFAEYGFELAA